MPRTIRVLSAALLFAVLTPGAAAAGGGWGTNIDFFKPYIATDQVLHFETKQILFQSVEEARAVEQNQGYFPYLVSGLNEQMLSDIPSGNFSPNWWRLGKAEAIRVGNLTVRITNANLAVATADLDLAGVPPGSYFLMFCDEACRHPLADIVPHPITVLEDPILARVANQVDALKWDVRRVRWGLGSRVRRIAGNYVDRTELGDLRSKVIGANQDVQKAKTDLDERLGNTVERIVALEKDVQQGLPSAVWFLFGGLVGATLLVAVRRRDRRSHRSLGDRDLDGELLDLLGTKRPPSKTGAGKV